MTRQTESRKRARFLSARVSRAVVYALCNRRAHTHLLHLPICNPGRKDQRGYFTAATVRWVLLVTQRRACFRCQRTLAPCDTHQDCSFHLRQRIAVQRTWPHTAKSHITCANMQPEAYYVMMFHPMIPLRSIRRDVLPAKLTKIK